MGPTPLYLQVLQWANMIISLVYPVAIVVILALALIEFRRLVRHQRKTSRLLLESKSGASRSPRQRRGKREKSS